MAYMRLGDLLVSSGIITGEQLEQALALPREDGQRLGDVLIRQGVISEAQLIDALRVQLGVDFVDLTAVSIPVELAKYVPRNLAKKFLVVPVKLVQDRLYLAMHDPLDFVAQDEVKTASRKRIIPMIATRKAVEQAIERLYGSEGTARVIEEMKREAGAGEDIIPAQMARDTADPEASAPTIRFVNSLIERAFTERASDIHLEPQEGEMLVRMRIDGLLQRVLTVPADLQNTVISRLKIMGGMNIAEHKVPQDGHAMFSVRGHSLDLRIASMPTVYGEKIVLRLLDKSAQVLDKSVLGLEGRDLDNYNALLKNTSGVVLLVGPTGSGKSTTMSNMLRDLSSDALNIVTLEDPVEYHLPGVNQCQINEKTGMTFASGLRAILRQDPDIIAVGEIRDGETASIAMRAAITGHLVFSTLHTNDAVSAVHRLEDIGVSPGWCPAPCGAWSASVWSASSVPTAKRLTVPLPRSCFFSACPRTATSPSTRAPAAPSAAIPATSAAAPCSRYCCSTAASAGASATAPTATSCWPPPGRTASPPCGKAAASWCLPASPPRRRPPASSTPPPRPDFTERSAPRP